jgi:CBS domain-containing protein
LRRGAVRCAIGHVAACEQGRAGTLGKSRSCEVSTVDFHLQLNTEAAEQAHPATPLVVEPQTTVREVMGMMKQQNRGAVWVCRGGVLVGVFTERDALKVMARRMNLDAPVEQVMSANPVTLSAQDTVGTAISKMSLGGYRRLAIVDGEGRPRGIVKVSGILHYLVEHFPSTVYTLPPRPDAATQEREGA